MRAARVENGALKDILKIETPPEKQKGLETLLNTIKQVSQEKVEMMVGGMAGMINKEGIVLKSPNLPSWDGCDIAGYLEENISSNVLVHNDALMAGLGEATYGAGKDEAVVAYIGLGTGIGGSRIVDKKIDSATGFEPGHHIVDFSNNESWEQKISGHVLKEKQGKYPQVLKREVYNDYIRKIAVGVYNAILFWSPDVVVMGGALINKEEGFRIDEITDAVSKINEFLPTLPPICQSGLGDNAGLYGAMAVVEKKPE